MPPTPPPNTALRPLALALACLAATASPLAPAADLAFLRDVKPILSDHCFACHGPDSGTRKAGLRLDTREGLLESTPKRPAAVIPGKPEESELWKRLVTSDPDDLMPPADAHKPLSSAQIDTLRRWIADGAPWQDHWAFVKPTRPPLPDTKPLAARHPHFPIRNPIDAIVLHRLDQLGLSPAPEADRRRLLRRVHLDLTGLPPTPAEVEAFIADTTPDAYERTVRRLLASPHWGEARARAWLDAARYADTHGLHFDNYREMWPYRDWVIRAFNRNLPFDRFSIDQIAGDLLPDPTDDQLIATGFHRCNATTNEGGTIEEENQVNYANDRVTTTSWVWLGLTANCASCHDHKFDPIPTRDFYAMAAFFRNTTQSGFDGNVKDGANASMTVVTDPADRARWTALPTLIANAKSDVDARRNDAQTPFEPWAASLTADTIQQNLARDLHLHAPLREGSGTNFTIHTDSQSLTAPADGPVRWSTNGPAGPDQPALHFDKNGSVDLGAAGDFDLGQPFSVSAWVFVPTDFDRTAAIIARMDESNQHRGWDLWIQQGQFAAHFVHRWPEDALKVRTRKALARKGEWQHVTLTFDGSGRPEGVRFYVDGAAAETERDGPGRVRGTLATSTPLRAGRRSAGASFEGGAVQDLRIHRRVLAAPEARALARFHELKSLLASPLASWKPEAREEVFEYFLLSHAPFQDARKHLATLEDERESLRQRYPVTHIQREKPDSLPMAAILARGEYDKPREKVVAATFSALHPFPPGAPTNRLGLAQWLVSPDNPLAARVTVNRFWQELFGVGLVKTTEDFGIMGEVPVHPLLLDWLAVEFVANGWDVKQLFETIVLSSTYRQDESVTPAKLQKDPDNRHFSRGPRFRMEAEMLRDYALQASGLLAPRIGGPSVKPYQPDGVWEAVAMPESNTREYKRDSGEALYRRSLYTFWKRSAPPALMDLFNAPSRESCTVRRERTNTPLQALATLNDPQFIEAARVLAQQAYAAANGRHALALDALAQHILARPLQPAELAELALTLDALLDFYTAQPDEAAKLIAVGDSPVPGDLPPPQLAALTLVANELFNLDEALTK